MQTFLPYPDFAASAAVLDDKRLGKQRVETYQILRALVFPAYAWKQHPAVRMWRGFVPALVTYGLACCHAWAERGFADRVRESMLQFTAGRALTEAELTAAGQLPPWYGVAALHESHQSALVRKEPDHYRPYFPDVPDDLPYLWPSDAFPRWPLRRSGQGPVDPETALRACGFDAPRAGQLEVAEAVSDGHDVLVCMPAGWGATSAGLAAAMTRPAPTLWITPHAGPAAEPPVERPASRVRASAPADEKDPPAPPALTARPPGPEDVLAMTQEAGAVPEHLFHRPDRVTDPAFVAHLVQTGVGLVVIDSADHLSAEQRRDVVALRAQLPPTPLVLLSHPAGPQHREALLAELQASAATLVGGGIDPGVELTAQVVTSETARRDALAAEIRRRPKRVLVVTGADSPAAGLVTGLRRRGVTTVTALTEQRQRDRDRALAAWRAGRVRALVVDRPEELELGRQPAALLVHAGPPPGLAALRDDLRHLPAGRVAVALLLATDAEHRALLLADDDGTTQERGRAALGRYLSAGPDERRCVFLDAWGSPCTPSHTAPGTPVAESGA